MLKCAGVTTATLQSQLSIFWVPDLIWTKYVFCVYKQMYNSWRPLFQFVLIPNFYLPILSGIMLPHIVMGLSDIPMWDFYGRWVDYFLQTMHFITLQESLIL